MQLQDTKEFRVLSIRQPWAWLVASGIKDIENRTWSTKYRGPVLIHASSKRATAADREYVWKRYRVELPEELETSAIIGVADLKDCVEKCRSRWMEGPIGWKFVEARMLQPHFMHGKLGLFRLPQSEVAAVRRRLARPAKHKRVI